MKLNKISIIAVFFIISLFILSFVPIFASAQIDTSGIGVSQSTMSEFDDVGSVIFGVIQGVGIGISVITLVVIGIKYLLASVEEKAEYKSSMMTYIIGVIFLAGATTIPNIIYNFAKTIKP